MITKTSLLVLLFLVTTAYSAIDNSQINLLPNVFDVKIHCKFRRNATVSLESIKSCCEVELKCLEYDQEGKLLTSRPEHKIVIANIKKINDWRAANKTQAVVICAPVLDDLGAIPVWENNWTFRKNMTNTTIPFLLKNNVTFMAFFWKDFDFNEEKTQTEAKRTINFLDEACESKCDVLLPKSFEETSDTMECAIRKHLENKKKILVRYLTDCEFVYNFREVIYEDGYSDTFGVGEPVINLKKALICNANTSVITDRKVHCEFRRIFPLKLEHIRNCCEVVIRCLQYDAEGKLTNPEPEWRITINNIENINAWRAANKTKAEVICALALNKNGQVPVWKNTAIFQENMRNSTKLWLERYNIKNLEIFMEEFGLNTLSNLKLLEKSLKGEFGWNSEIEYNNTLSNFKLLEKSLGYDYGVFYNETYEKNPNPETCLVQALEDQREEFRVYCDQNQLNRLVEDALTYAASKHSGRSSNDTEEKRSCRNEKPSKKWFEIKLEVYGYTRDQCDDLDHMKEVAYKDKTFKTVTSKVVIENIENVVACYQFMVHWNPDTSGKGKWFSPY